MDEQTLKEKGLISNARDRRLADDRVRGDGLLLQVVLIREQQRGDPSHLEIRLIAGQGADQLGMIQLSQGALPRHGRGYFQQNRVRVLDQLGIRARLYSAISDTAQDARPEKRKLTTNAGRQRR